MRMNRYVLGLVLLTGAAIPVASQSVRLPLTTVVQHPSVQYPVVQHSSHCSVPVRTHPSVPTQHSYHLQHPQQVLVPVIVDSYALPVVGSGLPYYYSAGEAYVDRYYRARPILEEPQEKKTPSAPAPAPSAPALSGTLEQKVTRIFSEVGRCVDCHQEGGKTSGGIALVQADGASWKLVHLPAAQRWQVVGVIAKKRMPPAARQDARQAVPSQYLVELAEWAAQVE
jgi:mono/diheme cytochrome c family protein